MANCLVKCSRQVLRKNDGFITIFRGIAYKCIQKTENIVAQYLTYAKHGDPIEVLRQSHCRLPNPTGQEVVVRMLAAPVNPADINTIQGVYPVKQRLPAIGGNEGVGEVIATGDKVRKLHVGDRVVPRVPNWGSWRTYAFTYEHLLLKVPKDLSIIQAATLTVNPCTAYRLLKDFAKLEPGDVIIQNAANGSVGLHIIQLCKIWGLRSVNIVRQRDDIDEVSEYLCKLGATHVITDNEVREFGLFKKSELPKPKLALNAVGGKMAMEMFRHLGHGGLFVTYGGMSREPVMVPTGVLIFSDVQVLGFWMTSWNRECTGTDDWEEMMNELISLMISGKLKPPGHLCFIPFSKYQEAVEKTLCRSKKKNKKYIFDFAEN